MQQDLAKDQAQLRLLQNQQTFISPQIITSSGIGDSNFAASQSIKRHDNYGEPVYRSQGRLNPPPLFAGQGARNWLFQIETYHNSIGQPEALRVSDAVSFLTGPALDDYGLHASQGEAPQTWDEFRTWILQRFNHQSESETVARLLQLRWPGSLDQLCNQFAAIVSQGEPPSHSELQRYFIRALPLELVDLLDHTRFHTWLQIKDFLIAKTRPKDYWKNMWLTTVSQSTLEETWRRAPHLFPTAFQQMVLRRPLPQGASNGSRPVVRPTNSWPPQPLVTPPQRGSNPGNIKCNACNQLGHVARQCPNVSSQLANDSLRCSKCGGVGHWAKDCPSKPNFIPTNNTKTNNVRHQNLNGSVRGNQQDLGNGQA